MDTLTKISYSGLTVDLPDDATTGRLFYSQVKKYQDKTFISYERNGQLYSESWQNFSQRVSGILEFLSQNNISKGDLIAVISGNSPECLAAIIAITASGCVCCPIHSNSSPDQLAELIQTYPYKLLLADNNWFNKIHMYFNTLPIPLFPLHTFAVASTSYNPDNLINTVIPDDAAYIMLSSGTTGVKKGIILTHDNILSNQRQARDYWKLIHDNDTFFGHLPLSHSYGGLFELYEILFTGARYHIHNYTHFDKLIEMIRQVRPSILYSVPHIWGKIYRHKQFPEIISGIRLGFSAGAPIDKDIIQHFYNLSLPVYQGYGLTETSPSLAISSPEEFITKQHARILPEIQLKISQEGEILVKGPNVSRGYFGDTAEQLACYDNGFLRTGDLGEVPVTGYLKLLGRKNSLIVLSTGEKIMAESLEAELNKNKLIKSAIIVGNNRPYISCIIIPDYEKVLEIVAILDKSSVSIKNNTDLYQKPAVIAVFQEIINTHNQHLAKHEKVRKFVISFQDITPEELTPTMKLKRQVFEENRKELFNILYG